MPRKTSRRRAAQADRSATVDIVTQLECAIRRPQATLIGALVGGLVPWFARTLAHEEVPHAWSAHRTLAMVMIAVVIGCAIFSGLTVYKFGCATFGDKRKAVGFVLAVEGVMLVSQGATSAVALTVLILINALSNGSSIALARDATCRRKEADDRRAATRRARVRSVAPVQAAAPTIEVVEAAPRAARRARPVTPALVHVPRWSKYADVEDAEIVSEERLAS